MRSMLNHKHRTTHSSHALSPRPGDLHPFSSTSGQHCSNQMHVTAAVGCWIHACAAGRGSIRHASEWSASPSVAMRAWAVGRCVHGGLQRAVASHWSPTAISLIKSSLYKRRAYPPAVSSLRVESVQTMEVRMDEKWKLSRKRGGGEAKRRSTAESLSRRCGSLVREQRAKFYIMRRCVVMLLCWRD
ncbi:uncharacterized protein LOC122047880 isoform X3 [Zingiber officinale]|uniref:uncharacterized protein LOC122047880 isoform X3 n=1 Tax=Zingiber officinale TaxID=94328 RepID=UPI001C4DD5D5|nr:uncharacterized protein LOC122047880 isoform X3 [Zingiber officinale]